jgi:hypothetical protein
MIPVYYYLCDVNVEFMVIANLAWSMHDLRHRWFQKRRVNSSLRKQILRAMRRDAFPYSTSVSSSNKLRFPLFCASTI